MKRSLVGELIKHSPKVPWFTFWIGSLRNECKTYTFVKHIIDGKSDWVMIWLSNSERVLRSNSEETEIRSTSFFVLYKMAKKVHSLRSCSVNSPIRVEISIPWSQSYSQWEEIRLLKRGRDMKSWILLRVVKKSSSLYFDDISSYRKCHYMGTEFHLIKGLNIYLSLNRQERRWGGGGVRFAERQLTLQNCSAVGRRNSWKRTI